MIYMFLADGFEETEAIETLDILRRAGLPAQTVGVGGRLRTGAHGVPVRCDREENELDLSSLEGVILPGGMPGTVHLKESESVKKAVEYAAESGKLVAAICAAPSILGGWGLLSGKRAVCFPGYEEALHGAEVRSEPAVADGNVITSRCAGTALDFALQIVAYYLGFGKADEVRSQFTCGN